MSSNNLTPRSRKISELRAEKSRPITILLDRTLWNEDPPDIDDDASLCYFQGQFCTWVPKWLGGCSYSVTKWNTVCASSPESSHDFESYLWTPTVRSAESWSSFGSKRGQLMHFFNERGLIFNKSRRQRGSRFTPEFLFPHRALGSQTVARSIFTISKQLSVRSRWVVVPSVISAWRKLWESKST